MQDWPERSTAAKSATETFIASPSKFSGDISIHPICRMSMRRDGAAVAPMVCGREYHGCFSIWLFARPKLDKRGV
jgi:hypothetical protein